MDGDLYLRAFLALVFVLSLIGIALWVARRTGIVKSLPARKGGNSRLQIIDNLALDQRHRLVLLRRDDVEHLVILGQDRSTVVESNIIGALPQKPDGAPLE